MQIDIEAKKLKNEQIFNCFLKDFLHSQHSSIHPPPPFYSHPLLISPTISHLSLSLSLAHTHAHLHALSLSPSLFIFLSFLHTHTLARTHSLSLSFSHSFFSLSWHFQSVQKIWQGDEKLYKKHFHVRKMNLNESENVFLQFYWFEKIV